MDNRHLSYLAKSIFVNVGGSQLNAKVSNPPMFVVSVGAVIVVWVGEDPIHGEGPQGEQSKPRCADSAREHSGNV